MKNSNHNTLPGTTLPRPRRVVRVAAPDVARHVPRPEPQRAVDDASIIYKTELRRGHLHEMRVRRPLQKRRETLFSVRGERRARAEDEEPARF